MEGGRHISHCPDCSSLVNRSVNGRRCPYCSRDVFGRDG